MIRILLLLLVSPLVWAKSENKLIEGLELEKVSGVPGKGRSLVWSPAGSPLRVTQKGATLLTPLQLVHVKGGQLVWQGPDFGVKKKGVKLPKGVRQLAFDASLKRLLALAPKSVFAYEGNGKFLKLLKTSKEITAVSFFREKILFATDSSIVSLSPGQKPRVLFYSSMASPVTSISVSEINEVVYFTTPTQIFALRNGVADLLLQGRSGKVYFRAGELYFWESQAGSLYRLKGLSLLARKR